MTPEPKLRAPHTKAKDGLKTCARCRATKDLTEFNFKKRNGQPYSYCKPCRRAQRAVYRTRPDTTAEARFWPKVNKTDGCWEWTGAVMGWGYGSFHYQGVFTMAHRVSLILTGQEIPPGMWVDHICRNHLCVRPEHLRIVTPRTNAVENNLSPFAKNAQKTHCSKGHEFSPENTAMKIGRGGRGNPVSMRLCLTCFPGNWRYAIVKRDPPPNARPGSEWIGPQSYSHGV